MQRVMQQCFTLHSNRTVTEAYKCVNVESSLDNKLAGTCTGRLNPEPLHLASMTLWPLH